MLVFGGVCVPEMECRLESSKPLREYDVHSVEWENLWDKRQRDEGGDIGLWSLEAADMTVLCALRSNPGWQRGGGGAGGPSRKTLWSNYMDDWCTEDSMNDRHRKTRGWAGIKKDWLVSALTWIKFASCFRLPPDKHACYFNSSFTWRSFLLDIERFVNIRVSQG